MHAVYRGQSSIIERYNWYSKTAQESTEKRSIDDPKKKKKEKREKNL